MSFSRECIEQEFAEAARLGKMNHHAQVERWESYRWFYEVGYRNARPVYEIKTIGVEHVACPKCGVMCERRVGVNFLVGKGGTHRCERTAA